MHEGPEQSALCCVCFCRCQAWLTADGQQEQTSLVNDQCEEELQQVCLQCCRRLALLTAEQ